MKPTYIIRLDDASEYMNYDKWNPFFSLFDKYSVTPIIAVIPFNKDPEMVHANPDPLFWGKVRLWQDKGYHIALHGYEHLYTNKVSGIIGLNNYSEFAGVSFEQQCDMLLQAYNKFREEKITTDIFVAPAHSFDRNTLRALKKVTSINHISDGYFMNSVKIDGFNWIPQQLWSPKPKSKGVWTICYHPETSNSSIIDSLESFLKNNSRYFVDPMTLGFKKMKAEDYLLSFFMKWKNRLQKILSQVN